MRSSDQAKEAERSLRRVERDRQQQVGVVPGHAAAELHGEAALGGLATPALADRVQVLAETGRGVDLPHQSEAVVLAHARHGRAHRLHGAPVEAEGVARDDGLVAEIHLAEAVGAVEGHVGLAHGEEGHVPGPIAAEGQELADHAPVRAGSADRVGRHERVAAGVRVGDHRVAGGREEVALVGAQREVVEGVRAVGTDELAGARPVGGARLLAPRERAEHERG
jgi:hypothetical protein